MPGLVGETSPCLNRKIKERKLTFVKYLLETRFCIMYIFYFALYNHTVSLTLKKTKLQNGYLLSPSLSPEHNRAQRILRFALFESLHSWPLPRFSKQLSYQ